MSSTRPVHTIVIGSSTGTTRAPARATKQRLTLDAAMKKLTLSTLAFAAFANGAIAAEAQTVMHACSEL